ncbi:glucose-1-phosphate adenylyltransferase subunit GlgD [Peptostreptococcus russellii]|uniref:glucose-1-phosphate adenylyltransferase subunit GlgD n=1 Tax=Peptostreptococcus russellii TaxID=215200 RepID=UPI001624BF02|nr:glucose-1-phosphate adenylyltransferase subunit GlgD [Peptostreptococcus russellii]MBC2577456.1 glucose-1-phosphate adenylyltransferase subunit GlgD [Peptostreptococcus russellii]
MDAFCILFADTFKNHDIAGFVKNRSMASLHVGCRYRMVDFMLSSLVKSSVPNIAILTTKNYNSLMDHVGWGKDWDLNRKNSGLKIIPPLAISNTEIPRNKFEALVNAESYIDSMLQDYCIISDSNIICDIDFAEVLDFHKKNHADITVLCTKAKPRPGDIEMMVDHKSRAYDSLYHQYGAKYECNTLLKITVMHKELLKKIIQKGNTLGWEDIVRDYISKNFNKLNVYSYNVNGYCKVIENLDSYFQFNMDLLNEEISQEIFLSGTEILTRVKDSVPTVYGKNASVKNSLLADGSHINGEVENSIIFRDVTIEEGASVKNSILMSGTVIKSGAKLDYVISDKLVTVRENKELKGDKSCQFTIPKGKII